MKKTTIKLTLFKQFNVVLTLPITLFAKKDGFMGDTEDAEKQFCRKNHAYSLVRYTPSHTGYAEGLQVLQSSLPGPHGEDCNWTMITDTWIDGDRVSIEHHMSWDFMTEHFDVLFTL